MLVTAHSHSTTLYLSHGWKDNFLEWVEKEWINYNGHLEYQLHLFAGGMNLVLAWCCTKNQKASKPWSSMQRSTAMSWYPSCTNTGSSQVMPAAGAAPTRQWSYTSTKERRECRQRQWPAREDGYTRFAGTRRTVGRAHQCG